MKNKKSKKKSLIRTILKIEIFIILCIATVIIFRIVNQARKDQQMLAQLQSEQEEITRQGQLKYQAEQKEIKEQEELERQEQEQRKERIEKIKKSLPAKFDMRNKIKINVEHQRNKPFCLYYAQIKAREIALNYQGNYDYDFRKVYKYLQTVPDEEAGNRYNISKFLKESIGFDDIYDNPNHHLETIDLKCELISGKPLLIAVDREFSINMGADPNGNWVGHDLVVIGYDDTKQSWLCLNSWGPNWGNNGTIWVEYDSKHILRIVALEEVNK